MAFYAEYPPKGGSGGVTTINTLSGAITLAAGSGITITPSGNTLTIASTGGSGANTFLSNLTSPTSINQDLLPQAGINLGSISNPFNDAVVTTIEATKTATDDIAIAAQFTAKTTATVTGSLNTTSIQATSTAIVEAGAENDKADGMVATVARGDGTDDGLLDAMTGMTAIIQHNSGTAGVTTTSTGFDVALLSQQGTITNHYDFRSQRIPIGGTVTNHYGLFLTNDSTTPVKSYMSGTTQMGGASFSPAASTLLDLQSTTGALLVPRMDNTARGLLTPSEGMIIYSTTDTALEGYMGGTWTSLGGGGSGGANQSLSNLTSPTAINQFLIFDTGVGAARVQTDNSSVAQTDDLFIATGLSLGSGNASGALNLISGDASNAPTGNVTLRSGDQGGNSTTGIITIRSGDSLSVGDTGAVEIKSGDGSGSGASGSLTMESGSTASGTGVSGDVQIKTGVSNAASGSIALLTGSGIGTDVSGDIVMQTGGAPSGSTTGSVTMITGGVSGGTGTSGDITLQTGASASTRGNIIFQNGSEGTAGSVWTSTDTSGSGAWMPASGGSSGYVTAAQVVLSTSNHTFGNIDVSAVNAKSFKIILQYLGFSGAVPDVPQVRFNSDSGTNYYSKWSADGNPTTFVAPTTSFLMSPTNDPNGIFATLEVGNIANMQKGIIGTVIRTSDDPTAPGVTYTVSGEWVGDTAAITHIEVTSAGGASFFTGAILTILATT